MSEPLEGQQAQEAPVDRKDLLAQQFSEAEASPPADDGGAAERARDERGRFAASDAAKALESAPKADIPVTSEPVEPPLWQRPPASWKKDYHEPWGTVDPKVQEYIWQRENEMAQGVEPLKTKAQVADAFEEAITPYKTIMQGLGVQPVDAIKGLMQNDYILRYGTPQQKQQKALDLIQAYGIDLNALMNGVDPSQYAAPDPQYQMLQNQLLELRGQYLTDKQMAEQAEEQRMRNEALSVTQGLEHYEAVKDKVVAILNAGLVEEGSIAEMTKAAYEKAIRLDDDLFQSIQAGKQASDDAAKREAAHKAAQSARRAAVSVPSSTPGTATKPNAQNDRRSMLEEQFSGLDRL